MPDSPPQTAILFDKYIGSENQSYDTDKLKDYRAKYEDQNTRKASAGIQQYIKCKPLYFFSRYSVYELLNIREIDRMNPVPAKVKGVGIFSAHDTQKIILIARPVDKESSTIGALSMMNIVNDNSDFDEASYTSYSDSQQFIKNFTLLHLASLTTNFKFLGGQLMDLLGHEAQGKYYSEIPVNFKMVIAKDKFFRLWAQNKDDNHMSYSWPPRCYGTNCL